MAKYWEFETSTGIYFWGGIFSNWYRHKIELPVLLGESKVQFNCVEQYMMVKKAEREMDQWELWKMDTKYGRLYITLSYASEYPDAHDLIGKENQNEKVR